MTPACDKRGCSKPSVHRWVGLVAGVETEEMVVEYEIRACVEHAADARRIAGLLEPSLLDGEIRFGREARA